MEHQVTAVRSALSNQPLRRPTVISSAVDSIAQRAIAQLLLKRDASRTGNPRLLIEDLDPGSQAKYMAAAITALREVDETFHVPALYAAVDAGDRYEGGDGLGSMVKDVRIHELQRFEVSLRAYRKHLSAESPAEAERFRKLADADRQ